MDVKAVCSIVFEETRTERSQTVVGTMNIRLRLECWETAKHTMRRFIVMRYYEITKPEQYAFDGIGGKQVPVFELEELYLCPVDTTQSGAIRIALGMWEDPNPVNELFARGERNGALMARAQRQEQEA